MKVRGWLIVGPRPNTGMLMPPDPIEQFFGSVPDATPYPPGAIIEWIPALGAAITVLVCVEIPL